MISPKRPNQHLWTDEAKEAFKDIQQALTCDTLLHCLDFEKQFVLQTDASDCGLGAVLLQVWFKWVFYSREGMPGS